MVMMEDGSPVPGSVEIKMTCNGSERTVTHTSVNDDFEFQWTRPSRTLPLTGVNSFTNHDVAAPTAMPRRSFVHRFRSSRATAICGHRCPDTGRAKST